MSTPERDSVPASGPFPIVAIGASAGGLEAITALLQNIPLDCGIAYVVIQHLDPKHESPLTELLSRATRMPVVEARDEEGRFHNMVIRPYRTAENKVEGAVIALVDIDELKRKTEALEKSAAGLKRLAAVVRDSHDAVTVQDLYGKITAWNHSAERMYGYSEGEALDMNFEVIVPEELREEARGLARRISRGEVLESLETKRLTRDGRVLDVWITMTLLRDEERNPTSLATTERDTTLRKETERALRAAHAARGEELHYAEARANAILETAAEGIIMIDTKGLIESFNPAAERIFGYEASEVLGKNINLLMSEPYHSEHDEYIRSYLETGEAKIIGIGREVEGRRKDGSTFPMDLSVSEIHDCAHKGFTGVVRDISERREMTRKLIEQESLAKLGEMAAIVAHEVKNPLAGIIAALDMLARRLPPGTIEKTIVEEGIRSATGLATTVQDILVFARARKPERFPVPIHALLEDVLALASADPLMKGVELSLSKSDVVVPCDIEMLKSVFLNICLNAAQAMEGSGKLEVVIETDGACCRKGCCKVSFKDTGPGIPEELRKTIFEPFFTTKRTGTGLGLPIARSAIELHGGEISAECPPGGGAIFSVQLPMA